MDNIRITKENMDMLRALNSPASPINVRNATSDFSRFTTLTRRFS